MQNPRGPHEHRVQGVVFRKKRVCLMKPEISAFVTLKSWKPSSSPVHPCCLRKTVWVWDLPEVASRQGEE